MIARRMHKALQAASAPAPGPSDLELNAGRVVSRPPRELLDGPPVAVRVTEEDEPAPREVLDVTHVDTAIAQLIVSDLDVVDDELHAPERPGHGIDKSLAHGDGAARARWRELHEPYLVPHRVVVIGVEPQLLRIEGLRPVNVGDRDNNELEPPIHVRSFLDASIVVQHAGRFRSKKFVKVSEEGGLAIVPLSNPVCIIEALGSIAPELGQ